MDRTKAWLGNGSKNRLIKLKICSPLGRGLTSALVTRTSMQVSPPVPPRATSWALQMDKIRYTVSWSHSQARSKAGLDSVLIPEFAVCHDPFFNPFPNPFCALVLSMMDGALYVCLHFHIIGIFLGMPSVYLCSVLFNSCIIVVSLPGLWSCTFMSGYQCVKQPPPQGGIQTCWAVNLQGLTTTWRDRKEARQHNCHCKDENTSLTFSVPSSFTAEEICSSLVPQHLHRKSISHTISLNPRSPPQLSLNTKWLKPGK